MLLWVLMLAFPFPYIANTLGWMTAELGRQPWLIYGLFHTADGHSQVVSNGNTIFTLIGFTGLYFVLGLLFLFLVGREIGHGPGKAVTRSRRRKEADSDAASDRLLMAVPTSVPSNGNGSRSNNEMVPTGTKERSL